ncbi:MAG: O-antigen ligase family protein [Verrucomicrobia bacterium]|nr:O-antigen ligase family protein [Verrucomicrobiota bacterium]
MRRPDARRPLTLLEKATLAHVGVLLLCASWVFGGNIWWARIALSIWASLSVGLTAAAFLQSGDRGRDVRRKAWWLLPLLLFSALVIASTLNPSFRPISIEGETQLVHRGAARPDWPSTANPEQTLRAWWFGAGVYLSAFNLVIILRRRSALCGLLVLIAANTLVLAVFGTLQKLMGLGFYFGAATSPNPRFFATFIYYNHWGAFMILSLTTAAGLLFYFARSYEGRNLWHTPFSGALMGVLFIAISAPVSASRAATVLAALVVAVATAHALLRIATLRRASRRPVWPAILLLLALVGSATGAAGWLALRSIDERYTETRAALAQDQSLFTGRLELYRDTWELAKRQPVFGWGLDSYGTAFQLIRPHSIRYRDRYEHSYVNAHCDWLQSLAETGFTGTFLLILMGALPLYGMSAAAFRKPLVGYPLLGCMIVLFYAWIEFPFGNAAVMITFWILLFTAIRLAQLSPITTR